MPTKTSKPRNKVPSRRAILRAVASSTAIETGKSVLQLETLLKRGHFRLGSLKLAK